jgi:enediyne biosynthesis protein E4
LQVKLEQEGSNRDGIGAWVEVKRGDLITRREITSGGGHASGHLGWWHVGLGAHDTAEVRVLWPDGVEGPWQSVSSDGFYRLARGNAPKPWMPE